MAASLFETRIRARSYELDSFGHVNHAVFLNYFEHARFQALKRGGLPMGEIEEEGWAIHVVRVEVDYRREVRQGDELLIRTRVERFRRSSMVIGQVAAFADDPDQVAAEARVVAVWIGRNGRPARVPERARRALGGG